MIGMLGRLHDVLVVQPGDADARARGRARRGRGERELVVGAMSRRGLARFRDGGRLQSLKRFVCRSHALASKLRGGEVAEWSNALDSKSSVRVIVPWVRIPPSPPEHSISSCSDWPFRTTPEQDPTLDGLDGRSTRPNQVACCLDPRRATAQSTDDHFVDSIAVEVHNLQPPTVHDQYFAHLRNSLELF